MSSLEIIEELKDIANTLDKEREAHEKEIKKLLAAISKIFPYDLYLKAWPGIRKELGNNKEQIINHYLAHGIESPVFNKGAKGLHVNDLNLENVARYAKDIANLQPKKNTGNNANKQLILSKTAGEPSAITDNKSHELARGNALLHLKSNSVCTWIPKIACSTMRYSIALDNGVISGINEISWIHQNNTTFSATNKELLKADYAFVILRNPFKKLISFFLDKICSDKSSEQDQSYALAKNIFSTDENTTFEQFVNTIYEDTSLISRDIHTRRQCDFLVYTNYNDYFKFEDFQTIKARLKEKIGLDLIDTRQRGSIRTTHKMEEIKDLNYQTKASDVNRLLDAYKKPMSKNMYTRDMIAKVGALYFTDILLYNNTVEGGKEELKEWMNELVHLDWPEK